MSRENVTWTIPASAINKLLSVSAQNGRQGGENPSLVISCEMLSKKQREVIGGEGGSLSASFTKPQQRRTIFA